MQDKNHMDGVSLIYEEEVKEEPTTVKQEPLLDNNVGPSTFYGRVNDNMSVYPRGMYDGTLWRKVFPSIYSEVLSCVGQIFKGFFSRGK